jgi:hypothetical protein
MAQLLLAGLLQCPNPLLQLAGRDQITEAPDGHGHGLTGFQANVLGERIIIDDSIQVDNGPPQPGTGAW